MASPMAIHTGICPPCPIEFNQTVGLNATQLSSPLQFSGTWSIEQAHEHSGGKARTSFNIHQGDIDQLPEYVNLAFHDCYSPQQKSNETWIEIQGTNLKNPKITRGWLGHEPIDWMVERAIGRIRNWAKKQPVVPQVWELMNPQRPQPQGHGWILEAANLTPETIRKATYILEDVIGRHYPDPATPPPWVITIAVNVSPDPNRYQLEFIARRADNNTFLLKHAPWRNEKPSERLKPLAEALDTFIEQVEDTWWNQATQVHRQPKTT